MLATINFNGQEYDSPAAMPPEVRQLYQMMTDMLADKNQTGTFCGFAPLRESIWDVLFFARP